MPALIQALSLRFDCIDEFLEKVATFDLDFTQLDRGASPGEFRQILHPCFQIGHGRFSRRLRQQGRMPQGLRTFAIPVGARFHMTWRGMTIDGGNLCVFPADGELDAVTEAGFEIFTVSIREEALAALAAATGRGDPRPLLARHEVFRCPPAVMDGMRAWLRVRAAHLSESGRQAQPMEATRFEQELLHLLLNALDGAVPERRPAAVYSRRRIVQRVEAYMCEDALGPSSTVELCRVARCSERTLAYAFRDCLGVTPKAFAKIHRLTDVRRGLRQAHGDHRVADVANDRGFWHMGQFAADYRKMFGELPSETLKSVGPSPAVRQSVR